MIVSVVKKDRSDWVVQKHNSLDEMRNAQIVSWQKQSGSARRKAAWELAVNYWVGIKKKHIDELRLQRTITIVKRRSR